jgi:GNAT superfamily N-acetyltransferase
MRIERLGPEREADFFRFFSGPAFSDNPEWRSCWCTFYHLEEGAEAPAGPREKRRDMAARLIREGAMDGYLAYDDEGEVQGWVNANRKSAYPRFRDEADAADTRMVVCFVIHPERRGRGIATALLHRVVEDARAEGYAAVEGRPSLRAKSAASNYHGPATVYERVGFVLGKKGRSGLARLELRGGGAGA